MQVVPHPNNVKALCNMFIMESWVILGFDRTIICFKHNFGGGGSNYMFNSLVFWCVMCDQVCVSFNIPALHLHSLPIMGLGY
jgi:hypothetical protein